VRASQGFFTVERTCHACGGAGKIIEKPCKGCNGAGRVRKEKNLSVNIPPGVEDGTRIRLAGEGEIGMRGAPPGDLYIFPLAGGSSAVQARGPPSALPRAAADDHRRHSAAPSKCRASTASRVKINVPGGAQTGQHFPPARQGHERAALGRPRRPLCRAPGRDAGEPNQAPAGELLREFEAAGKGKSHSPASEGFFAKVREFFEDLKE
jgi:molecular chaperone DnaJ